MSKLICNKCGNTWNGEQSPYCPNCLAQSWLGNPNMIRPKHDPTRLPSAASYFRSIVPEDLIKRSADYYSAIANGGTALYSHKHREYCYGFGVPPSNVSPYLSYGSAMPSGSPMPTYPLDGYIVAKPFGNDAHIYAENELEIQLDVADGTYSLERCSAPNCNNLHLPESRFCLKHKH